MNETFIEKVRASGYTTYRLSKLTGIPYTNISELMTGKKSINQRPAEMVLRLAAVLDTDTEHILDPVHFLDGSSGSYRGFKYSWTYNGHMVLTFSKGNEVHTIRTKYLLCQARLWKSYAITAEIYIDMFLEEREARQLVEDAASRYIE